MGMCFPCVSRVFSVHDCNDDLRQWTKHGRWSRYKQTRVATMVSDHACQIFGGRALTRSGMGQYVEKFQRSFKMQAILGGSEEILADFAIRQALKRTAATPSRL